MATPVKSGIDKKPAMTGDGAKIRTPMKDYKAKAGSRGKK